MPAPQRLAGGARPRSDLAAAAAPNRLRVLLTPPGEADAGPLSLWADVSADRTAVTLPAAVPGLAPGWGVSGRGFAGEVVKVEGPVLTVEAAS